MEVTVLEFENAEMAKKAGALLNTDMVLPMLTGIDDISIDDFEDAGPGDRSYLLLMPEPDEFRGLLLIFDDNLAFVMMARGADDSMTGTMLAIGEFLVNAEPGGDAPIDDTGEPSGVTWETLPKLGDNVLEGLVPMYNYDLLVSYHPIEPEATPAT